MVFADPLGAELLSVIARLNRWATRQADISIPPAQGRLLAQIDELVSSRIGDLARADHCSQPTMTHQVQRLEVRGWVERAVDPYDGRAVLISLTAEGRALLADLRHARAQVLAPYLAGLPDADRRRLADAVDALSALLEATAPAGDAAPTINQQEDD
ncbi:MAG: MarR family winged helix-turn-helix transcriptional regulator [Nocardioidaceae bacterium]